MEKLLIILVIVLAVVVVGQFMKVYQMTAEVRGRRQEDIPESDNRLNGLLFILFMVAFYGFFIWLMVEYGHGGLGPAASEHGAKTDWLLDLNFAIIIAVFFLTQTMLFVFAYRYYYKEDRKALFYPHNNKLELLWTVVPSMVLAVIIILGLRTWNDIMFSDDEDATVIEVYSEQFAWTARYAGADNVLGKADYKLKTATNGLGVVTTATIEERRIELNKQIEETKDLLENTIMPDWEREEMETKVVRMNRLLNRIDDLEQVVLSDTSMDWNAAANDDVVTKEIHLVVNKPYKFQFRSQDVIHSAYFPHFRAQMNTVPGMRTSFSFTPTITTDSMRLVMNDPKFDYVLLCNKICGAGHNGMQMKIVVESQEQYDMWLSEQKLFGASDEAPAEGESEGEGNTEEGMSEETAMVEESDE